MAGAVIVSTAGDSFTIDYLCAPGDECPDETNTNTTDFNVTAQSTWTVFEYSTTENKVVFDITMANTTTDDESTTNRITRFGVKLLDPSAIAASVLDESMNVDDGTNTNPSWETAIDSNFPGFQTVNFQATDSQAGGASGVHETEIAALRLELLFDELTEAGLELDVWPIMFQGVGEGDISLQFGGEPSNGNGGEPPAEIPAPMPLLLIGTGLLGLGLARRRR